jgi:uncharacterized repeat protein (TIGR03803 family)
MSKLSLWKTIFFLCALCAVEVTPSPAQVFTTLVSFNGTDGGDPLGSLVQGVDGNFYGTTAAGGANSNELICTANMESTCGTVFKITAGGTLTRLYSFCAQTNCTDGATPSAGLVLATDGNFYGTTAYGGTTSSTPGCGTVFKITPGGTLTTLHIFDGTDGCVPNAGLVQATDGNFYGTTWLGGANIDGTVFEVSPSGKLTTLHRFDGTDGQYPSALVLATDGNLYGTASYGGAHGLGTVFKITPVGTLTTLHSFDGTDGATPSALVQATDGNFYGTTFDGGANNDGTVFKITPVGTLTTLHSFDFTDGEFPSALLQGTDGNLYGAASQGGANDDGTVFKITSSGTLTTLHSFDGADGQNPLAELVQATNGNFYGTTSQGASDACTFGCGTVFRLGVGLGLFVETLPTSGKVGTAVIILGNNLTGSTSVTFNGTSAKFTVVSSSEIKTIVPSGATTGKVKVTTPHGTLTSNVNFGVP